MYERAEISQPGSSLSRRGGGRGCPRFTWRRPVCHGGDTADEHVEVEGVVLIRAHAIGQCVRTPDHRWVPTGDKAVSDALFARTASSRASSSLGCSRPGSAVTRAMTALSRYPPTSAVRSSGRLPSRSSERVRSVRARPAGDARTRGDQQRGDGGLGAQGGQERRQDRAQLLSPRRGVLGRGGGVPRSRTGAPPCRRVAGPSP